MNDIWLVVLGGLLGALGAAQRGIVVYAMGCFLFGLGLGGMLW